MPDHGGPRRRSGDRDGVLSTRGRADAVCGQLVLDPDVYAAEAVAEGAGAAVWCRVRCGGVVGEVCE